MVGSESRSSVLFEHDLFGKPVSTFPDHALEGGGVGFAGPDADRVIDAEDKNLAVANLAGFRRRRNRFDDFVHLISGTGDFELDLRQEAHRVFGPAVDFRVTLLTPITLDLGDRQPLHPDLW